MTLFQSVPLTWPQTLLVSFNLVSTSLSEQHRQFSLIGCDKLSDLKYRGSAHRAVLRPSNLSTLWWTTVRDIQPQVLRVDKNSSWAFCLWTMSLSLPQNIFVGRKLSNVPFDWIMIVQLSRRGGKIQLCLNTKDGRIQIWHKHEDLCSRTNCKVPE